MPARVCVSVRAKEKRMEDGDEIKMKDNYHASFFWLWQKYTRAIGGAFLFWLRSCCLMDRAKGDFGFDASDRGDLSTKYGRNIYILSIVA